MSELLLVLFVCIALVTLNKLGIAGLTMWMILIIVGLYISVYYLDSIRDIILNIANAVWWICAYWLSKLYAQAISKALTMFFIGIRLKRMGR